MNQEEKRIKIAEKCGWSWAARSLLPDYFNDLNACHEMEKHLGNVQNEENYYFAIKRSYRATAEDRAEAFGKTMKLW